MGSPFTIDPTTGQPKIAGVKQQNVAPPSDPFSGMFDTSSSGSGGAPPDPFGGLGGQAPPASGETPPVVPPPANDQHTGQAPPAAPPVVVTPPTVAPTPSAQGPIGFTPAGDPAQFKQVEGWLAQGGWGSGEDPNYWVNRIMQTGGFTPSNIAYWQDKIAKGPNGQTPDTTTTGQPSATTVMPPTGTAGATAIAGQLPGAVNTMDPQLQAEISKLLAEGHAPVSPDDPTIKANVDAYRTTQDRSLTQARAAAAEQAAYEGLPTASTDIANQGAIEREGQNVGGFQAKLMLDELQSRRQQVQQAMSFATGADQQALQLELANLNAAISQQGIGTQNQQFYDNLGVNVGLDQSQINAALQKLLAGG